MSPLATVTGLAIRELWMSFRLFWILLAYVVASFAVALVPSSLAAAMVWLAAGLGAAAAVAAMAGAWSVARERDAGRTGWLSNDAPRAAYVDGWFSGLAITALIGHVATTGVGWVTASALGPRADPVGYVMVVAAAAAACLATVAFGLLAGTVLPAAAAAVATLVVGIAAVLVVVGAVAPAPVVPGVGGFAVVAAFREGAVDIGAAAVAAGVGLATAAAGLVTARAAVGRDAS